MPLIQQQIDAQQGLNTTGFISGYRGSPLGGLDAALWSYKQPLEQAGVVFQPGVNEELAATAITGSQQLDLLDNAKYDGVYAMWYGKGPGVDRAMDAIKHGNYCGVHKNGGVLLAYGDDHPGKSSTLAHQSEQALAAQIVPSLYPAGVTEFIEYGLLGWGMSRYSGLWVGFKCVNETVEQTATIDIDLQQLKIQLPEAEPGPSFMPIAINVIEEERRVLEDRLPKVYEFTRANNIDKVTLGGKGKLGIVTAGKSWQDTQQALSLLGLTPAKAEALGISIYKVGCIWPLEPQGLTAFANQHEELLFIEEKKAFLESQASELLYNQPNRPAISGKKTPEGDSLLPSHGALYPLHAAKAIAARLQALQLADESMLESLQQFQQAILKGTNDPARLPYFCSGCPHNTSTKVPEGSIAMAGIGCHAMVGLFNPKTLLPLQMGGEGINWVGLAPFTETQHVFQNLGDGTYYHSGLLAIRAAVAAKVNITYKLLYNDATAMTGGQPMDGPLSVADISYQVLHEGVARCVIVSDHPEKFTSGIAPGVAVCHRDKLDQIQRELREVPGCTVIIYEQTCAAEKRRRRKRGTFPNPPKRLFINHNVCEGCGDCSAKSTCVSLLPRETALGRKRQIDQSSCNKDYSCQKGFCPSFVTVYDAEPKKPKAKDFAAELFDKLPQPATAALGDSTFNILITGIGGTGVVTVGAVLAMAAHLEGNASSVYDMTGLSQKNGSVYSNLKITTKQSQLHTQAIGQGEADLVLAFDIVAATRGDSVTSMSRHRTQMVGNSDVTPTVKLQFNPDDKVDAAGMIGMFTSELGQEAVHMVDATGIATALCGDSIATNMFLVGYALQLGKLPVSVAAIEQAIELNGVAVELNMQALRLGRLAASDPQTIKQLTANLQRNQQQAIPSSLADIITHRKTLLTNYQNAAYAQRYVDLVNQVAAAEQQLGTGSDSLATAVARYYAKLLAYKDEYEVARLHSDPEFYQELRATFGDNAKIAYNLAPPLLSRRDPVTEFGAWIKPAFGILAKFKCLRGTALDIFGYTQERKTERALITEYEELMATIIKRLDAGNYAIAIELASMPEYIRGYGHVKERHLETAKARQAELYEQFIHGVKQEVVKIQEPA